MILFYWIQIRQRYYLLDQKQYTEYLELQLDRSPVPSSTVQNLGVN